MVFSDQWRAIKSLMDYTIIIIKKADKRSSVVLQCCCGTERIREQERGQSPFKYLRWRALRQQLTLPAPGIFCLIMRWVWCPRSLNSDRKMLVTRNLAKIPAMGMMTLLIMSMLLKNFAKNGQNIVFSKINLVTVTKKIFKVFFQVLKVKTT